MDFSLAAAARCIDTSNSVSREASSLVVSGLERAVDLRFGFMTRTNYDTNLLVEAATNNRIVGLRPVSNNQVGELRGIQLRTGSVTRIEARGWIVRLGDTGAKVPLGQKPVVLRNDNGLIRVVPDQT